jgi:hypothetical protein
MARPTNIRGMLLEEALLHLLESTGYRTVLSRGTDPTLFDGPAGLKVRGRGSDHQIDAISDFQAPPPFSHPQRLLVEAKCFDPGTRVGIRIVREAVGILKDVSEFWMVAGGEIPKQRYHYQYAVFSATGYTDEAQRFAFAQDIYLIPLAASRFLEPAIQALRNVRPAATDDLGNANIDVDMTELRRSIRSLIRGQVPAGAGLEEIGVVLRGIGEFVQACHAIRYALMATLGGSFPVFLVPSPELRSQAVSEEYFVRIYRGPNDETWYLRDALTNNNLFSFDLPQELFLEYANQGILSERAALDLKEELMSNLLAYWMQDGILRLVRFRLDQEWTAGIRNQIERRRREDSRGSERR